MLALPIVAAETGGKNSTVNLNSSIEETSVEYELYYNDKLIEDETTKYSINIDTPLTESGKTKNFRINANSNLNKDLSIYVYVRPYNFKTTINDDEVYDSKIYPEVKYNESLSILNAGLNKDLTIRDFYLYWEGKEELPAGDYECNVKIIYFIQ